MDGTTTAPSTTPSASPATPTAAPATSAPSQTITPDQRPSMAQAFASDAALHPESPESTEPAATVPPAGIETPSVTPAADKKGPIPFEVHDTALRNARTKAAEEALAKHRESFGWAEQIPRADLERTIQQTRRIDTDPRGFWREYTAELLGHSEHGPALRSELGRMLGSVRGTAPVDLTPDMEVIGNNGQVVGQAFSADKTKALIQQAVNEAVSPLKQESEQRKTSAKQEADRKAAEDKATALRHEALKVVDTATAEVLDTLDITNPKAPESVKLLSEVLRLMDENKDQPPDQAARKAARQVRRAMVETRAQSSALDDLKTRAAAQSVNPAGAVVSTTHRPKSFHDPSLKW